MSFRQLRRVVALALAVLLALTAFAQAADAAKPKARVSIGINHASIHLGRTAVVHGTAAPNQHGHKVYLQKKSGSHWHSLQHKKLNAKSKYAFTVRPGSTGTKRYRIVDPATKTRARSVTRTVRLRVTRAAPSRSCTPGYRPCIPPASDVDCAGGSGNGPAYVVGPVYVTGSDPYDLDRDGDGVACE